MGKEIFIYLLAHNKFPGFETRTEIIALFARDDELGKTLKT